MPPLKIGQPVAFGDPNDKEHPFWDAGVVISYDDESVAVRVNYIVTSDIIVVPRSRIKVVSPSERT